MFDVIIRGGTVIDGSGGPERVADVAIRDGKIAAIDHRIEADAGEVIDATGRIVTPGFVDVHTHFDGQTTWDEVLEPTSNHGVTTVMMGNCGVGFAPVAPDADAQLIELIEGVEDIPGAALAEGLTRGRESFPQYLDVLSKRQWTIDVGAQLPHGPLRTYVMGPSAAEHKHASPDEIERMARLAREAMEAGAYGFTTSRTMGHRALDGTPVPGTYAAIDELYAIGAAVSAGGGRVFEWAPSGLARSDKPEIVAEEFDWIGRLAGTTGLTTTFNLLQMHTAPDRWRREMDLAAQWRGSGASVTPLVAGRPFAVIYTWAVRHLFSARPSYRAIAHLPLAERLTELRKPSVRAAMLCEADAPSDYMERRGIHYIRPVPSDATQAFWLYALQRAAEAEAEPALPDETLYLVCTAPGASEAAETSRLLTY